MSYSCNLQFDGNTCGVMLFKMLRIAYIVSFFFRTNMGASETTMYKSMLNWAWCHVIVRAPPFTKVGY